MIWITLKHAGQINWKLKLLLFVLYIQLGEQIIAKWQLKCMYLLDWFWFFFHSPVISLYFLERKFSYRIVLNEEIG